MKRSPMSSAIRRALETAGVECIDENGEGLACGFGTRLQLKTTKP